MQYAVEMSTGTVMYASGFIKNGSGMKELATKIQSYRMFALGKQLQHCFASGKVKGTAAKS
jgi:hypothetical protein